MPGSFIFHDRHDGETHLGHERTDRLGHTTILARCGRRGEQVAVCPDETSITCSVCQGGMQFRTRRTAPHQVRRYR